jgi:hypothetical protein
MWRVQSFQSASAASAFNLNNGDYYAYIEDDDRLQIMPTIRTTVITRGQYAPTIVGLQREMDKTAVTVRIRAANWRTALKNLSAACSNDEDEAGTLTVADESSVEWSIQGRVVNLVRTKFERTYKLLLDVPDLIWRKAAVDDTWNITASGQTHNVTNTGNRKIRPKFTFTPTSIKTDGFLYRHWVSVINPHSDRGFVTTGLELTDGGLDTRPWVKDSGNYVQINDVAGITDSQTTIPYDTLTGAIPTYGMGYIDDGVNVEQISWTGRTGTTSGNLTGVTRAIGGTTAHAFADNVKIYLSYCQADMRDVRVYKNGLEQNLWINAPNTAATRIWIVASERAGISLELGTAISAVGNIDEIDLKVTFANLQALYQMPEEGVVRIDNEAFHYIDKDPLRFKLEIDARAVNDTSAGAHTIGDTVYMMRNDYWLYAGNPFLEAQETDDTRKPLLELGSSNNVTRNYETFWDETGLRSDAWKPDVERSAFARYLNASQIYTGDHMADGTDPATEMGMLMRSIYQSGLWRNENGFITWSIYEPGGIYRVVSWVYEKYRIGNTWPERVRLEKSKNGIKWETVEVVTAPTSAGSWGSPISVGPDLMGTGYYYLRTIMFGVQGAGQSGGTGYVSALETNSLKYETVSPLIPEIMPRHDSSYEHNFIFKNNTNGTYFKIKYTGMLNGELEVDCEAKTVTTLADGKRHRAALFVRNNQRDWMIFDPGVNELLHTESAVTGLTVITMHEDQLAV